MRIDGFQNIPAILQTFNESKTLKPDSQIKTGASSSVSLSSFAEVIQSVQRESAQAANARTAKVEHLAQQAQTGKLPVDLGKLASSLVDARVINTKG